ncbi:MAG: DNA replication and repair protein RecF [Bacteroidaceae bacterium]|nr:DNA replication and repair protein RecF [Bacteroidaceae bacterium]
MQLEHLFVQDYRNIIQSDLEFSSGLNCFAGRNGMGKTNLLDAVYCLSFCKSSLAQSDAQTIRHGADCFQLSGTYLCPDGSRTIIGCMSRTKGRKQITRDRKEYQRFSDHIGYIPLVMMTPLDTELILGGSDARRRFMDMVISQYDSDYLRRLIAYGKALQQRNTLLKMEMQPDPEMLLMWEQVMAENGQLIFDRRRELIERIIPLFNDIYPAIAGQNEQVSLTYVSHGQRGNLLEQFAESRSRDRAAGFSLCGIHKDELEMQLGGYPVRKEGSQGQNKTYLTALMLAQYRLLAGVCGKKPILLLDDIFDRLDSVRVENILTLVSDRSMFGQVFITDVDRNHTDGILKNLGCECRTFTVENGSVR